MSCTCNCHRTKPTVSGEAASVVDDFLDETVVSDDGGGDVTLRRLYRLYVEYCIELDEDPLTERQAAAVFRDLLGSTTRRSGGQTFVGYRFA